MEKRFFAKLVVWKETRNTPACRHGQLVHGWKEQRQVSPQDSSSFLVSSSFLISILLIPLIQVLPFSMVEAQEMPLAITVDSSLGTKVNKNGSIYDITGGTRPGMGGNVFHSFDQFSIPNGNTANFLNFSRLPTSNILSRVTGGQPSQISGRIQTTGFGSANLYLLNPAGVVFGSTASLNVGGSFHVTTADYLKFGKEEFFHSDLAQQTVLSVASPEAFGFLNQSPAGIRADHSLLKVTQGNNLSLIGGNLDVLGNAGSLEGPTEEIFNSLEAPSGRLSLISVMSPGELPLISSTGLLFGDVSSFGELGEISSVGAGRLSTIGNPGGQIVIRAGKLLVEDTVIVATSIGEIDHPGLGIDIEVQDKVLIKGNLLGAEIGASSEGPGNAGHVRIVADHIEL